MEVIKNDIGLVTGVIDPYKVGLDINQDFKLHGFQQEDNYLF